jgi:hypothetical protein
MNKKSPRNLERVGLCYLIILLSLMAATCIVTAEVNYEFAYQDPAGDVLELNETGSELGTVATQQHLDIKWLRGENDTHGNVILRLEFKSKENIEVSNITKYVFRIFTSEDNSTGYNITYQNGSAIISNFNNTFEENMTSNISIIPGNGEVLTVKVLKSKYLGDIEYFNVHAFTWKEMGNRTYHDYVSELTGHPGQTDIVDGNDSAEEEGILDTLCANWLLILILVFIIIVIITVIVLKR